MMDGKLFKVIVKQSIFGDIKRGLYNEKCNSFNWHAFVEC